MPAFLSLCYMQMCTVSQITTALGICLTDEKNNFSHNLYFEFCRKFPFCQF